MGLLVLDLWDRGDGQMPCSGSQYSQSDADFFGSVARPLWLG